MYRCLPFGPAMPTPISSTQSAGTLRSMPPTQLFRRPGLTTSPPSKPEPPASLIVPAIPSRSSRQASARSQRIASFEQSNGEIYDDYT
jgi:hypothetical protein